MTRFTARPPAVSTVLADDDRCRVTRWDFEPGADTGWHRHGMAYLVIPMTDCAFLLEEATGERRVDVAQGAAYTREAGMEHNVVNGGDAPMSFIEIEFKR
jgi:quercetin dioxygenase-like cupin family protein